MFSLKRKKEKIDKTINEKIPQFKEHFKKVGIEFKDVKKIYQMGEVKIEALAGVNFEIN